MRPKERKAKKIRLKVFFAIVLMLGCAFIFIDWKAEAKRDNEKIVFKTNFADKEIQPDERIEIQFNRALQPDEGRLAVFLAETDLTALFAIDSQSLSYKPQALPLPNGESVLKIYLVAPSEDWLQIAEFTLKVKAASEPESKPAETKESTKITFTPNVTLNVKGQNQTLTFPQENVPQRNPFTDLAGQGNIALTIERGGWKLSNQFDFAGSSFQQEALRFSQLGVRAPRVDLSSYLMTLEKGRFNVKLGHVSFGSNRHLINSFSSRGINVTIPVGRQNEVSFAAMNGTSIVGFDNFVGVTRAKHSVVSATFAREFFKERPNGLRFEASVMRGSLLPLSNFNQGVVNDAEKSLGFGFRVIGSDTTQRLRFEGGFTQSRFTNPNDPQLEQGLRLTEICPNTRNARYSEISFDFLQGLKLWREKKLKVTGTFRHEEIQPLFRSIVASTQADKRQNQFEISATFGEINFAYGNLRDRDNLNEIASILKTLSRRNNLIFGIPLNSFFTPSKPIKWLPQISYNYEHVHQFGAFLPVNGEFRDLSQVPDQDSFSQTFNAQWQLSDKFRFGYRYNRAFQDNRQPGRDLADFQSAVNALTFGVKPHSSLDLNFDLSQERQKNFETPRIDRTFRLGTNIIWQTPFLKNSTLSATFSTTLAGDTGNKNDSRNAELDLQWLYKFSFGTEKFKKLQTQFFIRYSNRYGDAFDRVFFNNSVNKTQTFNAGLSFNIF